MALAFFTLWKIKKKPTQVHTRKHWEGIMEKLFLSRIKKEEATICCEVLEKHKDFLFGCHKVFPLSPYICSSHSLSLSLSVRLSFSLSLSLPPTLYLFLPLSYYILLWVCATFAISASLPFPYNFQFSLTSLPPLSTSKYLGPLQTNWKLLWDISFYFYLLDFCWLNL